MLPSRRELPIHMTARQTRKERRAAERAARNNHNRPAAPGRESGNGEERETELPHTSQKSTRAEINRANAQHSTGPKTAEGKNNSKRNSFKHGLYSKDLVCFGEDPAELDELRASLHAEHQPATETEEILVNEIAEHFWRLRRMRKCEALGMQDGNFNSYFQQGLWVLIARNMASAERGMYKAIATLRQMQKDRKANQTAAESESKLQNVNSGFVPSNSAGPVQTEEQPEPESGFVFSNAAERADVETHLEPEFGFVSSFSEENLEQTPSEDLKNVFAGPPEYQTAA